jgi:hypothetical protein
MLDTMRQLYPRGPVNRGICVDPDGATLGPDCVLVRRTRSGFRPIERGDASMLQKCALGADRDQDWLFRQCQRIADALNRGEIALAQIHGLYIPIGELDDRQLRRLATIRFAKAGFNPDESRLPKGDPHGGERTTGGGVGPSHPAHRLVPGHMPAPPVGDTSPVRIAQMTATESASASVTRDTPPQLLAQLTTTEPANESPAGALGTGPRNGDSDGNPASRLPEWSVASADLAALFTSEQRTDRDDPMVTQIDFSDGFHEVVVDAWVKAFNEAGTPAAKAVGVRVIGFEWSHHRFSRHTHSCARSTGRGVRD